MSTRVPREEIAILNPEIGHQFSHSSGVLVAAVEQHNGTIAGCLRLPAAIEKVSSIPRRHGVIRHFEPAGPSLSCREGIALQKRWLVIH